MLTNTAIVTGASPDPNSTNNAVAISDESQQAADRQCGSGPKRVRRRNLSGARNAERHGLERSGRRHADVCVDD